MESLLHPPRGGREPLFWISSIVEWADEEEGTRNWVILDNLLPRPPELLEQISLLGRVLTELPPSACYWTHTLPVHTWFPALSVPVVGGTVGCTICGLLVPGE